MYNPLPKILEDLKANTTREIENISKKIFKSIFLKIKKGENFLLQPKMAILKLNKICFMFIKFPFLSSLKYAIAHNKAILNTLFIQILNSREWKKHPVFFSLKEEGLIDLHDEREK